MKALLSGLRERLGPVVWNAVAGALPRVAVLLAGLYVARTLGADAFARYSLAAVTFALLGSLPGATLTTTASKFVPEFSGGDVARVGTGFRVIAKFALVLATVLALVVYASAGMVSRWLGVVPPIVDLLHAAALTVFAAIVAGGFVGLLVGSGRFRGSAIAQVAGFVAFAVSILPLGSALGAAGVLFAIAILYAVASALAAWDVRRGLARDTENRSGSPLTPVLSFFAATLVAAGFVTPVVWMCNALLAHGEDALVALSQFNAAQQWYAVALFAPAVLAQVEFVRMSQAKARGDVAALSLEMRRFTARNALVMLPLLTCGVLMSPWLAGVYRLDGTAAERTMQIMFAAAFAASLGNPAGLFLAVVDRIWLASGLNVGWGIITLAATWLLRDYGAVGVACAFLAGHVVHAFVATAVAHRLLVPRTNLA
jgi:O-antigen/teichoic acid export membrane protein